MLPPRLGAAILSEGANVIGRRARRSTRSRHLRSSACTVVLAVEKKGDTAAIDRSIMARIAQDIEDRCLMAMKAQLEEDGWAVLALVFDGAIVRHREGHSFDFGRLQARILRECKLNMTIEEKPLFEAEPMLLLNRNFGA